MEGYKDRLGGCGQAGARLQGASGRRFHALGDDPRRNHRRRRLRCGPNGLSAPGFASRGGCVRQI